MGSFDATCVLSDIGISYGDKVYAFILCSGSGGRTMGGHPSWYPVTYGVQGTYDDYGVVNLDEEYPQHILDTLGRFVKPFEQGKNRFHESAVNPNALTWELIQDIDRQGRLWAQRETYGYKSDTEWKHPIQKICDDNDIKIRISPLGYPGGSFHYGEITEWEIEDQIKIVNKLTALPDFINSPYQMISIPREGIGYSKDTEPGIDSELWQRGLLFAPKLKQHSVSSYIGRKPTSKQVRLSVGLVRKDVFDSLMELDAEAIEISSLAREMVKGMENTDVPRLLDGYLLKSNLRNLKPNASFSERGGLWYGGEGHSMSENIITAMIASTPTETFEQFNGWLQALDMYKKSQYSLRRGLRPTPDYVGSQNASEDWPNQLKFHKKMAEICEAAMSEDFYIYIGTIGTADGIKFEDFDLFTAWANEALFNGEKPNPTLDEAMQAIRDSDTFEET